MATLAVKLYESTHGEDSPIYEALMLGPSDAACAITSDDEEDKAAWKRLRFSFYFGMAYGLARAEEPFASERDLTAVAEEAATKAAEWGDRVGGRPEGES